MKELILEIEQFKQQIAYSINNSRLPADIQQYILNDFVSALRQQAQVQLYEAKNAEETESTEETEENNDADN